MYIYEIKLKLIKQKIKYTEYKARMQEYTNIS